MVRQEVTETQLLSVLHSPITAVHQGSDLHSIAIGYETGEVVVGFIDGLINETPPQPYGTSYLSANSFPLKEEHVESFSDTQQIFHTGAVIRSVFMNSTMGVVYAISDGTSTVVG